MMCVDHAVPVPVPLRLSLMEFIPDKLISRRGLPLEPLEVLKVIHKMTRPDLLLEDVLFVEEKNEGCVIEPILELDLSEQLDGLL